jgi:small subunit ribosomal protein S1
MLARARHLKHDFPLSDPPRTVPYCNPFLSVSGVHHHMTSSTEATSTPKVAVNDIGSEEAFLAAIDETIKYFNDGDIVEGTVVKVDRDEVLLDIGYKTEGVIPSRELSIKHDVDPHEVVKTGEHIEALVLQKEDKEGRLILSKKRAQYERAWGTIEKIKDEDGVVTGTVIEVVKGGLILDIGLRGFLPASLVEMRRVRDLQPYVGKEIEAKIIELDRNRNNVVLSRRAWLEQTQSEVRQNFLNTLQKGQIRKGVVSSIVNFGAFVDLGGVDGLVHVSELSWKHIDHPGEVVEVGQEVTVEVLDVDMDRERVSLSLKSTQEDPWQQFARTHQIGQVVPGRVTKLVPFGAFVRVEEGIEGLVHISELADRHVEIPEQVVQVGDEIFVKIIDIDLDRRRISLSLKQANEGATGEGSSEEFDPTLYGMPAAYDDQGNYVYPEGFDSETQEWMEGFESQREEWERQYAEARARYEAHQQQVADARTKAESAGGESEEEQGGREHRSTTTSSSGGDADRGGTLASDEALAALREKLSGGQN